DVARRIEEVRLGERAVLEMRGRERRDDALLDLRAGPALRELLDRLEVELIGVDATAAEVHLEDLDALVVERKVDEEDLVEAALADQLGRQEVDPVRRGADEEAARLLLHPGKEEGEDAAELAFLGLRVDAGLDLVEPHDGGRHRLEHVAGARERGLGLAE